MSNKPNAILMKDEFRAIRRGLFLTQKELSLRSGIALGTYKSWELGLQQPSFENFQKYIEFLKTTPLAFKESTLNQLFVKGF